MASNGKPIRVTVELDPTSDPPFRLTSKDITIGPGNEIVFSNKNHPGFLIFFDLDNSRNPGYFFPNNPEAALWSKTEDSSGCCPRTWQHWNQFLPKAVHKVQGQNRTLVVRNINGYEKRFGYTLRVTKTPQNDNGEFLDLDPGGTNTNGPSLYSMTATTLLVAGAATTASFFAVTSLAGNFVDDGVIRLGTALLAALTAGFGIAALWDRYR